MKTGGICKVDGCESMLDVKISAGYVVEKLVGKKSQKGRGLRFKKWSAINDDSTVLMFA